MASVRSNSCRLGVGFSLNNTLLSFKQVLAVGWITNLVVFCILKMRDCVGWEASVNIWGILSYMVLDNPVGSAL